MTIPTQDRASSVQGVALRVSRLNADGTIPTGADSSYVMNRFVTVSYTPQYTGGQSITQQGANGALIVAYQTPDVMQRIDFAINISDPDPQFLEICCGGTVLVDNTVPAAPVAIGYEPPDTGVIGNPNGFALEVWSLAIQGGRKAVTRPYFHYLFPKLIGNPTGDHAFDNAVMAQAVTGFGESNPGFGNGPDHLWNWGSDRPYQNVRSTSAPIGINGYQAV